MGKRTEKVESVHRADVIMITAALVAVILLILFSADKQPGGYVRIEQDGELVATYPLVGDNYCDVGGNRVAIVSAHARMDAADCPDKLCIKQGAIDKNGEAIVCLPNRIVVTIVSDVSGVDAVTG